MIRFFFLAATCSLFSLSYFQPPSTWETAQLKSGSEYVQVGFLGKGSTDFRPSINIAFEEVDGSLKDYMKAVKEIQMGDPKVKWRDLGKFKMQAGEGRLTEITNTSPWGEMKVLQLIFVKDGLATILTAAVLKKDFPQLQEEILKSFRSLNITPDLWTLIPDVEKKEKLQGLLASRDPAKWEQYQQEVAKQSTLGSYWQFLALQEGLTQLKGAQ